MTIVGRVGIASATSAQWHLMIGGAVVVVVVVVAVAAVAGDIYIYGNNR